MTRRGRRLMRRKMDTVLATWNVRTRKVEGNYLEEDLRKLGVKGLRRKAEDREECRHVVKKAEALHGL
jgi:hypothetical protein